MPPSNRNKPILTPYWQSSCGRAVVYVGDCREVMARMEAGQFHCVVTDPPYGLEFMGKEFDTFRGESFDPAFCHWFAGFTDGEGCFSVHKKKVNGFETYDCQFSINLRSDDKPILERIHRQLRIGTIADRPETKSGHSQTRYCVSAKAECVALRDLFRSFPLRAKKARDFEHWSDALDTWLRHEPNDWAEMAEARRKLMSGREFTTEGIRINPFQMFSWRWAREALRVAKPGAHLLSFGGTRTWHRMACAIEDANWGIRDTLMWVYGSGFPKPHNVSKAIDKLLNAEREVVGEWEASGRNKRSAGAEHYRLTQERGDVTAPATEEAKQWDGWGSSLKPSFEPVLLCRKPLVGTLAQNTLEHGCGGINVDGCRIGAGESRQSSTGGMARKASPIFGEFANQEVTPIQTTLGRWPANLVHDGSDQVVELFPEGAARYFYSAKANEDDRPHGKGSTTHPTVKPLDLMRWLVRLVCPPNGLILDPFMGSGSTGCAAIEEGMRFVGIDQSQEYADLAVGRLKLSLGKVAGAWGGESPPEVERI